MINQIDFTELKEEVMNYWDEIGVAYLDVNNIDEGGSELTVKPEYQAILESPIRCIQELGFDSFANYLSDKKNKEFS